MWSSVGEVYPAYVNPVQAPVGQVLVNEPQVVRQVEYRPVQPPSAPYETNQEQQHYYTRRLWIC